MSASLFTNRELKNYSITKALSEVVESQKHLPPGIAGSPKGLELEVSDALKAHFKSSPIAPDPMGFLVPIQALKGLSATTAATGGFAVGSDFAASIVPALRNVSRCAEMGASVFEGLRGDAVVPFQTTTSDAQWLGELEAAADPSDATYAQSKLTPRRVVSVSRLSQQLLSQSSLGIENFVRADLLRVVGTALDKAPLVGSGNKEPLGLLSRDDSTLNTVTFSGAASFAKMLSFQSSCAADNAYGPSGYLVSPSTAEKLQQLKCDSTGIRFAWEGDINAGTIGGSRAFSTNQIPASDNRVVYSGDWSQLVIGVWNDALQLVVDSYSFKKTRLVEIVSTVLADVGVINAAAFAVSTDSGAQ